MIQGRADHFELDPQHSLCSVQRRRPQLSPSCKLPCACSLWALHQAADRWRAVWSRGGLVMSAAMQVEAELRELDPAEAAEYLQSLGASEGGLASLISAAYRQLGLLTYFTTGSRPSQNAAQAGPACGCQPTWQSVPAWTCWLAGSL